MFGGDGRVTDDAFRKLLEGFLERFIVLIEKFVPAR